ncbi:MAG: urease accessory protein [Candidatus Tectomicrobia bacterium]|nr:urease accessory protein [Candidatus Tectomicrobia bacterium]
MLEITTALSLGLVLGAQHALEADHMAAVSALLSEQKGLARACLQGAFWGVGHTLAILSAALVIVGFGFRIFPNAGIWLELGVAAILIYLGGRVLLHSLRDVRIHRHRHAHDGHTHTHLHLHTDSLLAHQHVHLSGLHLSGAWARPLLVGLCHGLAGSGALVLFITSSLSSRLAQLLFVLTFGLASSTMMFLVSFLIGIPFKAAARRSGAARASLQGLAGIASLALGLGLAMRLLAL